ncbi:hypothetical protein AAF712_012253, partial [Marasmius tenuissimus]
LGDTEKGRTDGIDQACIVAEGYLVAVYAEGKATRCDSFTLGTIYDPACPFFTTELDALRGRTREMRLVGVIFRGNVNAKRVYVPGADRVGYFQQEIRT